MGLHTESNVDATPLGSIKRSGCLTHQDDIFYYDWERSVGGAMKTDVINAGIFSAWRSGFHSATSSNASDSEFIFATATGSADPLGPSVGVGCFYCSHHATSARHIRQFSDLANFSGSICLANNIDRPPPDSLDLSAPAGPPKVPAEPTGP